MPYQPPPELGQLSLDQIAALVAERKLPPVAEWSPERTVDSQMQILADGSWLHCGSPITRPAMVRAFASLLTCDSHGQRYLMTPFERQSIAVEDAPFIAVDLVQRGGDLAFRLNTDELVLAGADHPIRAAGDQDCPALYLMVRHGCEARLNRSTYAQIAEIALSQQDPSELGPWQVTSQGVCFSLVPQ